MVNPRRSDFDRLHRKQAREARRFNSVASETRVARKPVLCLLSQAIGRYAMVFANVSGLALGYTNKQYETVR